jgi:hypothetical protein
VVHSQRGAVDGCAEKAECSEASDACALERQCLQRAASRHLNEPIHVSNAMVNGSAAGGAAAHRALAMTAAMTGASKTLVPFAIAATPSPATLDHCENRKAVAAVRIHSKRSERVNGPAR